MVRYELVILGGLDNPRARVELRLDAPALHSPALRCAWADLLAARDERSLAQLEAEAVRVLGRHGGMPLPDPTQAERLGPPWLRESLALLDDLDPVDVARSAPAIEALGRRFCTP